MFEDDDFELMRSMGISSKEPDSDGGLVDVKPKELSEIVIQKRKEWKRLTNFLEKWFYKPDMEALKICLSVYCSHMFINDPIWMFIISPPGSGKTSIAIKALGFLPNTYKLGDINVNSFLSGYGENNGILGNLTEKHSGNGVLLFPDFTGLLTKKYDTRAEIMGQMRQIYDGYYSKSVGNKSEVITWKGKVTCIAAVTPVLENYWGTHRSLGERFLNVRWKQPDGLLTAEYAERQVDHETEIRDTFEKLVREYVGVLVTGEDKERKESVPVSSYEVHIEKDRILGLRDLDFICSILRTNVTRDNKTRKIVDVDEPETPTRIAKSLAMIAKGSATLDHKTSIDASDLALSHRVAIDSIDKHRGKVMAEMLDGKFVDGHIKYEISKEELETKVDLPPATFKRVLEDLTVLKVIVTEDRSSGEVVMLTHKIASCWDNCISYEAE
jgi:hypothetical protein